jgi:hypothetical protein
MVSKHWTVLKMTHPAALAGNRTPHLLAQTCELDHATSMSSAGPEDLQGCQVPGSRAAWPGFWHVDLGRTDSGTLTAKNGRV